MRIKLWKQVSLSLLLPVLIASAIVIYAVYNLDTISKRIKFIEIADDINLTLLELRRYEKNILLFHEDANIKLFHKFLEQIDKKISEAENEIIEEPNRLVYGQLKEAIKSYRESANLLISNVMTEKKQLEDIRPLGRLIEKSALSKGTALELRRYEKNYIIYKEELALDNVRRLALELERRQPALGMSVTAYMKIFNSFVKNESLKNDLVTKLRDSGRSIEKLTMDFANKKRLAIDKTISSSKKLLIFSFIFLVISTSAMAFLFSSNILKVLKTVGTTFERLKSGDFNYGIDLHDGNAPEEVMSFARSYNQTIEALGSSKVELENTLRKLEDVNRELIENQEAIVEAKKFTAMRLLASEIAHEINNPLSSLTTFLGICCEDPPADEQKKEILDLMLKEVNRCRSILRELVEFAKKEPLKIKAVNPASLLKDAIKVVLKQHEKSSVNLTAFCSELPREVLLDPVLIHQALVNILNNAYQFTSPGGSIDIEGYVDCDSMVIEIKDSGTGISEENLPYVFEPFFSTRKELGGSGLGLAITKKIIERHNGSITVESKVEKETVFTIRLPLVNTLT
jgi:two-component system NtrC family sensor kinase